MSQLDSVALIAFNRKHEVVRVVLSARYVQYTTQKKMLMDRDVAEVNIYAVENTWSAATYHPEAEEDCR